MKKKLTALLLVLCMLAAMCSVTAFAQDGDALELTNVDKGPNAPTSMVNEDGTAKDPTLPKYQKNMAALGDITFTGDAANGYMAAFGANLGEMEAYNAGPGSAKWVALVLTFSKTAADNIEHGSGKTFEDADVNDAAAFGGNEKSVVLWLSLKAGDTIVTINGKDGVKAFDLTVRVTDTTPAPTPDPIVTGVTKAKDTVDTITGDEAAGYKANMQQVSEVNFDADTATITVKADVDNMTKYLADSADHPLKDAKPYALVLEFGQAVDNISAESGYGINAEDKADAAKFYNGAVDEKNLIVFWLNAETQTRTFTLKGNNGGSQDVTVKVVNTHQEPTPEEPTPEEPTVEVETGEGTSSLPADAPAAEKQAADEVAAAVASVPAPVINTRTNISAADQTKIDAALQTAVNNNETNVRAEVTLAYDVQEVKTETDGVAREFTVDVTPVVTVYSDTNTSGTPVDGVKLTGAVTFHIPVPADFAAKYVSARVLHNGTQIDAEAAFKDDSGIKYIVVTTTNGFSPFTVIGNLRTNDNTGSNTNNNNNNTGSNTGTSTNNANTGSSAAAPTSNVPKTSGATYSALWGMLTLLSTGGLGALGLGSKKLRK